MNISAFGGSYFLDEKSFVERMTQAQAETDRDHPWNIDEIIEIQHRMRSFGDFIAEHLRQSATPDPMDELRRHLNEMVDAEYGKGGERE